MLNDPIVRVVTARRRPDLAPVWLTEDDLWTTSPEQAERLTDDAVADVRLFDAMARRDEVCCATLQDA